VRVTRFYILLYTHLLYTPIYTHLLYTPIYTHLLYTPIYAHRDRGCLLCTHSFIVYSGVFYHLYSGEREDVRELAFAWGTVQREM
jgi:hypothetical protein